jgi:hypothetical protein
MSGFAKYKRERVFNEKVRRFNNETPNEVAFRAPAFCISAVCVVVMITAAICLFFYVTDIGGAGGSSSSSSNSGSGRPGAAAGRTHRQ